MNEFYNIIEKSRKSSGRSTRLLDKYIQDFFFLENNEVLYIADHEPTKEADLALMDRFINRMNAEHPDVKFNVDRYERTISKC